MKTKVSVIIAVYNIEPYVTECLNSVTQQTYQNLEITVVDDGSTDNSGKICDAFAQSDSRVKVIHKNNEGLPSARIDGFAASTGDYVIFMDGDDFYDLTLIEKCLAVVAQHHPDVVMVKHNYIYQDHREPWHTSYQPGLYTGVKLTEMFNNYQEYFNILSVWSKLVRRDCYVAGMKYYDRKIRSGEDKLLVPCLLQNIDSLYLLDEPLYNYRRRKSSISHSSSLKSFQSIQLIYQKLREANQDQTALRNLPYAPAEYARNLFFMLLRQVPIKFVKNILRDPFSKQLLNGWHPCRLKDKIKKFFLKHRLVIFYKLFVKRNRKLNYFN